MKHPPEAYADRTDAGRVLAARVRSAVADSEVPVVLALPRGGVPIGYAVANVLAAPLDVFVVRKLGVPGQEELAMGAIATGGYELLNQDVILQAGVSEAEIAAVAEREAIELIRREEYYRANRPSVSITDRTAVLVDDGLATGFSMRAAIAAVRERHPSRIVVAAPVGAPETCAEIAREVDAVVCPLQPPFFRAVGLWYVDFTQTSDEEVRQYLAAATEALSHRLEARG